jgi:hypothetical protein
LDSLVEGVFVAAPVAGEGVVVGDFVGEGGVEFGEGGVEDPHVGLGEGDGDRPSVVGQLVALALGNAADETFAPESAQVVVIFERL